MLTRRAWLARAVGAAAATALPGRAGALPQALATALPIPPELITPALIAQAGRVEVWPGRPTAVWTLGGGWPSSTIRVGRGELLRARLENRLGEATNVHWHGLAPPAAMDGHPADLVPSGGAREYRFQVLEPAGTYWYHPHPHGRTAAQVYRGMAGFLIVEDEAERELGLPAGERDVPLLLQDRRRRADGALVYAPTPMDLMAGYLGDAVLVNGAPDAELSAVAAPYRFRLLNGSNARVFRVAWSDRRAFHVLAGDAGLLERPVSATELFLGPGERAELLMDLSSDAGRSIDLVSVGFAGRFGFGPGRSGQGVPMRLLRVRVGRPGAGGPAAPPSRLGALEPLAPERAEVRRRFVMEMRMPPFEGSFLINGRSWDPDRVDVRVERGPLELWEIVNASLEPHPFHVHATQFRVVSRSSGALGPHEGGLKDTVMVWPGERVELAVRFERYAGLYVLHCHNLEHEDAGMMLNLEVA